MYKNGECDCEINTSVCKEEKKVLAMDMNIGMAFQLLS